MVFRKWIRDPNVALFSDGQSVVDGKVCEGVTLLNSQNDSVSVYLDLNTHYPVKIEYSWRDPKDKQKNVEEEHYDNYNWCRASGRRTPLPAISTEKLRNSASSPRPATTRNCRTRCSKRP